MRKIERDELAKLVKEMRGVMTQREITPQDAKNAVAMLEKDIDESIARYYKQYIISEKFM